jgi:16S rRNA (uracil1498-N3)-methyltransferase
MKIHRFYIEPEKDIRGQLAEGKEIAVANTKLIHQIVRVLRLRAKEYVILFDNTGYEYSGIILVAEKSGVHIAIKEKKQSEHEMPIKIFLYQSVIKKDNFETAIQKGVETGVSKFVPILSAHSEKKAVRMDRMEKIIREAAEQSGRSILPTIEEPRSLFDALEEEKSGVMIFCDQSGESLMSALKKHPGEKEYHVFVGPEGGWTTEERNAASDMGAHIIRISPLTLRAETVAPVITSLLLSSVEG